jgi:hypothetical protein
MLTIKHIVRKLFVFLTDGVIQFRWPGAEPSPRRLAGIDGVGNRGGTYIIVILTVITTATHWIDRLAGYQQPQRGSDIGNQRVRV